MTSSRTESAHPPVALLVGPEATLRDAALLELREQVLAGGPADFNEDRFDLAAAGTDPGEILVAARTVPVMSPGRLVLVRGLGARRATKFLEDLLLHYLESPLVTTCLVLEAERVDRRQKWVKLVAKVGELRECKGPSRPAELRSWIGSRLESLGKRAGSGVASALLERVGPDLDRLAMELDKVCLFVGERGEVSGEDVAAVTGDLRPRALYELTDAIGARQLAASLRLANQLIDQGDVPLVVLAALANHFRRLLRARECRPLEASEVQQRLGLHPYAAKKLVEQVRRFDLPRLRACLDAVRRTDEALKGATPLPAQLAIERLVLTVCT